MASRRTSHVYTPAQLSKLAWVDRAALLYAAGCIGALAWQLGWINERTQSGYLGASVIGALIVWTAGVVYSVHLAKRLARAKRLRRSGARRPIALGACLVMMFLAVRAGAALMHLG